MELGSSIVTGLLETGMEPTPLRLSRITNKSLRRLAGITLSETEPLESSN